MTFMHTTGNPVADGDPDWNRLTPEQEATAAAVVAQAELALDAIKRAAHLVVPLYAALSPVASGLYTADAFDQVNELLETLATFAKAARRNIASPDLDDADVVHKVKEHRRPTVVLAEILGRDGE